MIVRLPVDPFARQYVYFFAIAAGVCRDARGVLIGVTGPIGGVAPLVVLSGLAVVVAAGDAIHFGRQHIVIATWFGLLFIPPIMTVLALYCGAVVRHRSQGHAAGRRDGAFLRRELRAPHRHAAARSSPAMPARLR